MVNKLDHYALENPASVYDEEAMTALELAGRTAKKVNECVDEISHIPEKVAVDVQKHIDNGDFAEQVDKYAGELTTQIKATESRMNSKVTQTNNTLNARMDNLLNNYQAGSTTMDAEVLDGRVGADNVEYANLGTAIRTGLARATQLANASIYINYDKVVTAQANEYSVTITFPDRITFMYHGVKEWYEWADITANIADMCTFDENSVNKVTITLPNYYKNCLVFSTLDKQLYVRAADNLQYGDLLLASFSSKGQVNNGLLANLILEQNSNARHAENELNIKNTGNAWLYIGSDRPIKIETADTAESSYTYITIPGPNIYLQYQGFKGGKPLATITANIAEMVTVEDTTYTITIEGYRKNLVYNTIDGMMAVRASDNIQAGDILLLGIAWNNVNSGLLYDIWLKSRITALEGATKPAPSLSDTITTYGGRFNGLNKTESFLYFTDPHTCKKSEDWESIFPAHMNDIEKAYNTSDVDFVVCGGDWLGNADTQVEACAKLRYIRGMMRSYFGENCYNMIGNHDTNYQGVLNAEAGENTGELADSTIANLWFPGTGKTYYEFTGRNTRFFVFNTGLDWTIGDTAHRKEQITWFANSLLTNTDEHIALMGHIYEFTDGNVLPMADTLTKIAEAFNNRTSIEVDGVMYSYTGATGKVHFYMCGHRHMDKLATYNSIPVVITANVRFGAGTTFDMVLVDYDNNKLYLDRCGEGESRVIDI